MTARALLLAAALSAGAQAGSEASPEGAYGKAQAQAAETRMPGATGGAALSPPDSAGRPPGVAIVFSCVLQVEESGRAAKAAIAAAESLGGWFTRRAKAELELRVPAAAADSFIAGLAALGVVLDRNLSTESLEGERGDLTSRLKARRAMLQDYYAMLKESGDSTVFTIQSEIVDLQTEIEQTADRIRKLEERMAFANVTVRFRFHERSAPLTTGQSRFPWLNRLGLPNLMERYDHAAP